MGMTTEAPSLPKQLFEINCRNFSSKEKLARNLPAHRHRVDVVMIPQNGWNCFHSISYPSPVLKILCLNETLLPRAFYGGTGQCYQIGAFPHFGMALLQMRTLEAQFMCKVCLYLFACGNIFASERLMTGGTV